VVLKLFLIIKFAELVSVYGVCFHLTETGFLRLVRNERVNHQENNLMFFKELHNGLMIMACGFHDDNGGHSRIFLNVQNLA
jgi:hypothetical protein